MYSSFEPFHDLCRNVDRLHRLVGPPAHTGDRERSGGDALLVLPHLAGVAYGPPGQFRDANAHLELLLEGERPVKLARRGDAGPADLAVGGMDAQAGLAPERVL